MRAFIAFIFAAVGLLMISCGGKADLNQHVEGRIAFTSNRDGDDEIYVVAPTSFV